MDARFNIYSAPEESIPAEDKARLEGYLKGREEEARLAELARLKDIHEEAIRAMEVRAES